MKRVTALLNFLFFINIAFAADRFVVFQQSPDYFPVISNGVPCSILTDSNEEIPFSSLLSVRIEQGTPFEITGK